VLDGKIAEAIAKACDELLAGKLHDHFIVDMIRAVPAPRQT
jgi:aspartate ammonia-lyase